jgi:hypothetical protein
VRAKVHASCWRSARGIDPPARTGALTLLSRLRCETALGLSARGPTRGRRTTAYRGESRSRMTPSGCRIGPHDAVRAHFARACAGSRLTSIQLAQARTTVASRPHRCAGPYFWFVAGPGTRAPLPLLIVAGSKEKSRPAPGDSPRRLVFRGGGSAATLGIRVAGPPSRAGAVPVRIRLTHGGDCGMTLFHKDAASVTRAVALRGSTGSARARRRH